MRPITHHGGHRMDPRTIIGALAALYAAAVAAGGYATDVVTGERGTAVGVALLVGAVATAAGTMLWRQAQAWARTNAEAMSMLSAERVEHANTRLRLDRTERKLETTEHKLALAEVELQRLRRRVEELTDQRD